MIDVDTLLHCRWVVPVVPRGLVLENHAVAIDDGRIVAVVPDEVAAARYRGREVVHLDHHAVTPGFVNAHTHAAMTLLRGVGDDLPLMRWLTERIWPLEKALVSPGVRVRRRPAGSAGDAPVRDDVRLGHVLLPGSQRPRLPGAGNALRGGHHRDRVSDRVCLGCRGLPAQGTGGP